MEKQSFSKEDIENCDPNRCWVDNKKNISDKHHIIPIEYGGPKDGLTVPLCPTCHRNIHREATAIYKNSNKRGDYVNSENYPKYKALQKAEFLVQYIVVAQTKFAATGERKAEGARNMAQISFTREELAIAHDVKQRLGFRSLERCLKFLVLDKYKQLKSK